MGRFDGRSGAEDAASRTVQCPFCGSTDTTLEQRKGTAMCRIMYQCRECNEPFEQFD